MSRWPAAPALRPAAPLPARAARVLVYQLGSIGDTVVSLPALVALRRYLGPSAAITLLHETRRGLATTPADVLAGTGLADDFLGYPVDGSRAARAAGRLALAWRLRERRFDAVVYLAPAERSARQVWRDRAYFALAGCGAAIGFHAYRPEELYPADADGRPARVAHEALFRLERLARHGVDVAEERPLARPVLRLPERERAAADAWLAAHRRAPERPLVAVCPGAKQPTNLWPLERFREIGRRLAALERFELVVVGGPAERQAAEELAGAWGGGLVAAGALSVLGSAALLQHCAFVVGLDTGTTHLASASGIPCVALYGERDNPGRWEPMGEGHLVLRARVPCAGCRIIMAPCPQPGHPCMADLDVEAVWKAVLEMCARLGRNAA